VWKKWEEITISVEEVGGNYYQSGRSGRKLLSVWKKWEEITISVEEVGENYYQCGRSGRKLLRFCKHLFNSKILGFEANLCKIFFIAYIC
jgi:DNA-binding PadR family transcriptional regulator